MQFFLYPLMVKVFFFFAATTLHFKVLFYHHSYPFLLLSTLKTFNVCLMNKKFHITEFV